MIETRGLCKSFGSHVVLDGIDLNVAAGTTFALLGPNGAGKITMVHILSTLIRADRGEVRVAGHDLVREPAAVRAAIGVTSQFSAIDNLLTGEEDLLLMADLHHLSRSEGRRRAAELLERFELVDAARKTPATYSGGMRRRLDLAMTPVIMLLLFVYVFGGALSVSPGAYINYVVPGIIIMTVGSGCATTALNLCMDMSEGIITRFRTMAISPSSVLTGQVIGSLIRTMISIGLISGLALLMGFRPAANPLAWLAALGLIALITFAVTWMGVAFGLVGKTPAGANSLSLMFQLLAFTSSAFVRPDSMPAGVRWFAEYQPFTPIIDTLRGMLLGTPIASSSVVLAIAWCIALTLLGYFWARAVYNRNPVR